MIWDGWDGTPRTKFEVKEHIVERTKYPMDARPSEWFDVAVYSDPKYVERRKVILLEPKIPKGERLLGLR